MTRARPAAGACKTVATLVAGACKRPTILALSSSKDGNEALESRLQARGIGIATSLGQRIEFFPPHCDPTINLYDRIYAMRGQKVEAIWEVAGRGRSQ